VEQKHQNKDGTGVVNAKGAGHAARIVRKSDNVKIKGLTLKFLRNMNDLLDKAGKGVYKATNNCRKPRGGPQGGAGSFQAWPSGKKKIRIKKFS